MTVNVFGEDYDLYQEAIQHIDNNKLIVSIDDTVFR